MCYTSTHVATHTAFYTLLFCVGWSCESGLVVPSIPYISFTYIKYFRIILHVVYVVVLLRQ